MSSAIAATPTTETTTEMTTARPSSTGEAAAGGGKPKPRASSLLSDLDEQSDWNSARRTLNVRWVTVALWMACCAYIIAVFQAVPVSLHFQVGGTSVPTPVSQFHLGMGLAVFRIFTFVFGSPLGIMSNRFGRKPVMSVALCSYIPVFALFAVAWYSRPSFSQAVSAAKYTNDTAALTLDASGGVLVPCADTPSYNFTEIDAAGFPKPACEWKPQIAFYYVCYVIMGIFTPYQPHAIGYVSDVSPKTEMISNQSFVAGCGYFFGLFGGFVVALVVFLGAGGRENQETGFTGRFVPISYFAAMFFILVGLYFVNFKAEDSIPPKKRTKKYKCTDCLPAGFLSRGMDNKYFMATLGYSFWTAFGGGANESVILMMFQRWYLPVLGEGPVVLMFVVYALLVYLLNIVGAIFTVSMCYIPRCGFKNSFHLVFWLGLPTIIIMMTALNSKMPSLAWLVVIWLVSLTSTGPMQPLRASLFMGQAPSFDDRGAFSGMLRSIEALGKAVGALIVGSLLGPTWNETWKASVESGGAHEGYWTLPVVGYLMPLILSYVCFILGEGCCVKDDVRGWDNDDENRLVLNCCKRGGLLVYGDEEVEKV
jgi:MFS family permease